MTRKMPLAPDAKSCSVGPSGQQTAKPGAGPALDCSAGVTGEGPCSKAVTPQSPACPQVPFPSCLSIFLSVFSSTAVSQDQCSCTGDSLEQVLYLQREQNTHLPLTFCFSPGPTWKGPSAPPCTLRHTLAQFAFDSQATQPKFHLLLTPSLPLSHIGTHMKKSE